jgi:diguanylate cyclase (GGDEF)-like protein
MPLTLRDNGRVPRPADSLLASALDSLSDHVAILDPCGRIVAVNAAWRRFAVENGAADPAQMCEGANYLGACGGDADDADGPTVAAGIRRVVSGEVGEFVLEYPCHSPTELRWFEVRATQLADPGSDGVVVIHSTITQRKIAEQRLSFLAHHDELTGLPNRRRVMETLSAQQPTGRLGVLLLDLDNFKLVNDTHGHNAGNDVLCAVADALSRPLPGGALAGRHGGDEFCVALLDVDAHPIEAAAAEVYERVRTRLSRTSVAGAASVSVGGTRVAADEPLGLAMQRADEALYAVKHTGRDGYLIR